MREMMKVFKVCALALAVLFGTVSSSAAEKKGPTGKTRSECEGDFLTCHDNCPIDTYEHWRDCVLPCYDTYIFCIKGTSRKRELAFDVLVRGQITILQGLNSFSPPDLVPLPRPASTGPESFCRFNSDFTKLQVQVTNQSGTPSGVSTTHVEFANNAGVDMPTPVVAAFSSVMVEFPIPSTCYDALNNCHFTIGVDFTNAVNESDETNNNAAGVCGAGIL